MLGHEADGVLEVGIGRFAALERAPPEFALGVAAAAEGEHHRQCDLSFAEIVADVLAEVLRRTAVVERVVDQLEGDADSCRTTGRHILVRHAPQHRADSTRLEQLGGLGADPAMYSSSVVAVFLAAAGAASPSAIQLRQRDFQRLGFRPRPSSNAWPSRKSPTSTLASFPHSIRAASRPRRISLSSTTSSCSSVAVCMNSTAAASLMWPSPA
jgi:hypothetical protein